MITFGQRISGTDRDKIWMSIRIFRRFTVPDLMRTTGAKYRNTKNFIRGLTIHGYITEVGKWTSGRTGAHKHYRLIKDLPKRPTVCEKCGNLVSSGVCSPDNKGGDNG